MDGLPQLRSALDEMRRRTHLEDALVVVDNGSRGPNIIDTRGIDHDVIDGLIPGGVIAALADLDDPSPKTLLAAGFDVVIRLHDRGDMKDEPILLTCHWRPDLVPGCNPPEPIWVRIGPEGFVRDQEAA